MAVLLVCQVQSCSFGEVLGEFGESMRDADTPFYWKLTLVITIPVDLIVAATVGWSRGPARTGGRLRRNFGPLVLWSFRGCAR